MAYINLDVDYKTGQMFEYSRVQHEGFVEHTNGAGKVSYRRYFKNIEGTPFQFKSDTGRFGEELNLLLASETNEGLNYALRMGKHRTDGSYDSAVLQLLGALKGADMAKPMVLSFYNSKYQNALGEAKTSLNCIITQKDDAGQDQKTGFIPFSEVPKSTKKTVAGKVKWDNEARDEFYYNIETKIIADSAEIFSERRANYTGNGSSVDSTTAKVTVYDTEAETTQEASVGSPQSQATPTTSVAQVAPAVDDDLPF